MSRQRGSKNTTQVAELTKDEQLALDLRVAGKTFREIAQTLNMTGAGAHGLVMRALKRSDEAMAKQGAKHRELEAQRLNVMVASLWSRATGLDGSDSETQHKAIDRVVKLMERRAKMLGIDAPTRSELTGKDGKPIETVTVAKVIAMPALNEPEDATGPVVTDPEAV